MIVLCAHRLYTPREEILHPLLFIEDGLISVVSSRAEREIPKNATVIDFSRDFPDAILAPGYVDIHMHGGAGLDVMLASLAERISNRKIDPYAAVNEILTKAGLGDSK